MKLLFMSGNEPYDEGSTKYCILGIQIENMVFGLILDMSWKD